LGEVLRFNRQEITVSEPVGNAKQDEQCRKNTSNAPFIKRQEGKPGIGDFRQNDRPDQVARNDEEYVYADIAAPAASRTQVVCKHQEHGNATKAVDIGAI